jgi:hypothetical protein
VSVRAFVASSSADRAWGKLTDVGPASVASVTSVYRLQNSDDYLRGFASFFILRRNGKYAFHFLENA